MEFVIIDGQDVNLMQVKTGMAWFYRYYQKELSAENRKIYAQAEDQARSERHGLWQDKNPVEEFYRILKREYSGGNQ